MKIKIKRLFYRILKPFRKLYWFIVRPETRGVKCLIKYQDKFLCIRNSYYPNWTFPGGGVNKNEEPSKAATRELLEEVGIDIKSWIKIGEYLSNREYKRDRVYCFYTCIESDYFKIDNDEIIEAKWFTKEEIPTNQSSAIKKVLDLYNI